MESNGALVLDYLKASGIDSKEITQGLPEITDREDERIQMNRPALSRYKAVVTLVIRSAGVDLVKKAIQGVDALLEKGVTLDASGSQQTDFIFNEVNDVKPDMIREATANARAAAEKFAQDSHSKVGLTRGRESGFDGDRESGRGFARGKGVEDCDDGGFFSGVESGRGF